MARFFYISDTLTRAASVTPNRDAHRVATRPAESSAVRVTAWNATKYAQNEAVGICESRHLPILAKTWAAHTATLDAIRETDEHVNGEKFSACTEIANTVRDSAVESRRACVSRGNTQGATCARTPFFDFCATTSRDALTSAASAVKSCAASTGVVNNERGVGCEEPRFFDFGAGASESHKQTETNEGENQMPSVLVTIETEGRVSGGDRASFRQTNKEVHHAH